MPVVIFLNLDYLYIEIIMILLVDFSNRMVETVKADTRQKFSSSTISERGGRWSGLIWLHRGQPDSPGQGAQTSMCIRIPWRGTAGPYPQSFRFSRYEVEHKHLSKKFQGELILLVQRSYFENHWSKIYCPRSLKNGGIIWKWFGIKWIQSKT